MAIRTPTFATRSVGMDSDEALMIIREAWSAWALKQIDEVEFAARVADALELANFPVIRKVETIARDNDEDGGAG